MAISFTGDTAPAPNVQVGINANGTLTIDGSSGILASTIDIGVGAGVTGTVLVTGGGSFAELTESTVLPQAIVGDSGAGIFNILNGGEFLLAGGYVPSGFRGYPYAS